MTDEIKQTEAQAIIDAISEREQPYLVGHENSRWLAFHREQNVKNVTAEIAKLRPGPSRPSGTVEVSDALSLANYVRVYQGVASGFYDEMETPDVAGKPAIFADARRQRFTAIMNYHLDGQPAWADWRAVHDLVISEQLKVWTGLEGKGFITQGDFAAFIEDNFLDVYPAPTGDGALAEMARDFAKKLNAKFANPGEILTAARGLEINESSVVKSTARQQDGTVNLQFTTEHRDGSGAQVQVPKLFSIAVPIFEGSDPRFLPVLLQYRVHQGGIKFGIKMPTLERARREAFDEMVGELADLLDAKTAGDVIDMNMGLLDVRGEPINPPIFRGTAPEPTA